MESLKETARRLDDAQRAPSPRERRDRVSRDVSQIVITRNAYSILLRLHASRASERAYASTMRGTLRLSLLLRFRCFLIYGAHV